MQPKDTPLNNILALLPDFYHTSSSSSSSIFLSHLWPFCSFQTCWVAQELPNKTYSSHNHSKAPPCSHSTLIIKSNIQISASSSPKTTKFMFPSITPCSGSSVTYGSRAIEKKHFLGRMPNECEIAIAELVCLHQFFISHHPIVKCIHIM